MAGQKQHVDLHRKLLLRKALLRRASEGAVYVPFCGDGDIAAALYIDRPIYAADLDPKRVEVCRERLSGAIIESADCDQWPFPGIERPFAVADFDAYVHPYASFLTFWTEALKARRMALFFTDGHRQGIARAGVLYRPDGTRECLTGIVERRRVYNFYWTRVVEPWFRGVVAGWRVLRLMRYLRGAGMLYWGALIERSDESLGG